MQSFLPQMRANKKPCPLTVRLRLHQGRLSQRSLIHKNTAGRGLLPLEHERNPNSDTARLKATRDIEAKIIARTCMRPSEGYACWTVTLLAQQCEVIMEELLSRATVGRIMQTQQNPSPSETTTGVFLFHQKRMQSLQHIWKTYWTFTGFPTILPAPYGAWMKNFIISSETAGSPYRCVREQRQSRRQRESFLSWIT